VSAGVPKVDETHVMRRLVRVEGERDAWLERCQVLEREIAEARRRVAELEAKGGA
jgi:hypothetical protein